MQHIINKPFTLYNSISKSKQDIDKKSVMDLFRAAKPYDVSSITGNVTNVNQEELAELFSSVLKYITIPNNMFTNTDGDINLYFEGVMPDDTKHAALLSSVKLDSDTSEKKSIYIYQLSNVPSESFWNDPSHLMAMFLYAMAYLIQKQEYSVGADYVKCPDSTQSFANKNRIVSKVKDRIIPVVVNAFFIKKDLIVKYIDSSVEKNKKRLHNVRGHVRKLKSGKHVMVRPHSRGSYEIGETKQFFKS